MELRDVIEKYRSAAGGFGKPVPLGVFGLSRAETERLFSVFDEDYHISRYFHFSADPAVQGHSPQAYEINGFAHTHVSIDPEIEEIL